MNTGNQRTKFKRKLGPNEVFYNKSPYSVITLLARVSGSIREEELKAALAKLQRRHLPLKYHISQDDEGLSWFTADGTEEIPYEIMSRTGPQGWVNAVRQASQTPFQFDTHPALKVLLLDSSQTSDLILICHHILADGISLVYLMRDLLILLGDSNSQLPELPAPEPISAGNLPADLKQSGIAKLFMNRINKKWAETLVKFTQVDYQAIAEAYWSNYSHPLVLIELDQKETEDIVARCKEEGVTVNSALTTAFQGAVSDVVGEDEFNPRTVVAADLRDRLAHSPGESPGVYAGGLDFKFKYDQELGFWENARKFHSQVVPLYTNKNLFQEILTWTHLHPTISEGMTFKKLGGLLSPDSPQAEILIPFSQREDVIQSILKREKLADFETVFVGNAITNLTRLDIPTRYGDIELERVIFKPGGAFPLSNIHLLIGAVTCAGKLSLTLEYSDRNFDEKAIQAVKEKVLSYLGSEQH